MNDFRKRLTANAEDFDGVVVDILNELESMKDECSQLKEANEQLINQVDFLKSILTEEQRHHVEDNS